MSLLLIGVLVGKGGVASRSGTVYAPRVLLLALRYFDVVSGGGAGVELSWARNFAVRI